MSDLVGCISSLGSMSRDGFEREVNGMTEADGSSMEGPKEVVTKTKRDRDGAHA